MLLVGGGTVGHLAPGFALAEVLRERGVHVGFATPGGGGEERWFPEGEIPVRLGAPRLPTRRRDLPRFAGRLGRSTLEALRYLRRRRPDVVVGLGGWPCVPTALAASLAHVPLVLLAADARPGVAVRRLAPLAARIYVSGEEARYALVRGSRGALAARVRVVGPVLRRAAREGRRDPARFGLVPDRPTLLVVGGSLGALALNRAVVAGVERAVGRDPSWASRFQILHSVGRSGQGVVESYRRLGVRHHVTDYIEAMGDAYRVADLVVCRAGAQTCAELEAAGIPAVLVPYPHHADRQQYENARPLVARGAALLVEEEDLDAAAVEEQILPLLADEKRRAAMALHAESDRSDGARQIADDLVRFLHRGGALEMPPSRGTA